MQQFLLIIRGAPASGKSTIAKKLRNFQKKVVWLKVDNFKDFFSEEASLDEQKYVDECALSTLSYLLNQGFSVVMEKIFFDPSAINIALDIAKTRNIQVAVYQLECPLDILQARDRNRPGIKEGCRKPLGDETIKTIFDQLERTKLINAITLNTANLSLEQCVDDVKQRVGYSLSDGKHD